MKLHQEPSTPKKKHCQGALDAPRFCIGGLNWYGTGKRFYDQVVAIEHGMDPVEIERLKELGHEVEVVTGYERIVFGKGQIITRTVDPRSGRMVWAAASDPRGDGMALAQI